MTTQPTGVGDFTATTAIVPADLIIAQETGQVIAAAGQVTYGPFTVTSPSYGIALDAVIANTATQPVLKATVDWVDSATGLTVDEQAWYWVGTPTSPGAVGALTTGRGPTNADTVFVTISNFDPAQAVTIDLALWQSSRIITRHDWRGIVVNGLLPGYSVPSSNQQAAMLAWENSVSIGVGATFKWLCPLFAGQVLWTWNLSSNSSVAAQMFVIMPDAPGGINPTVWNPAVPATNGETELVFPRAPVDVQIHNGGAAAITVSWSLAMLEIAS